MRQPEQAEQELAHIVESFRDLSVAELEVYTYFDVDGTAEAAFLGSSEHQFFDYRNGALEKAAS